ncbi:4,5-dihydroxyphthalate decarboxylase [Pseudomonas syringae pv. syringae]|uniref:ABC transporter substrate-binding protein n=2 Tax=Pseudomonas syringae TaxID=317 RepID=UPI0006B9AD2C|nr:ABC transporter substrate-binding protein [Pseudomonas syringae]KPB13059.1 4,5-dihydroxyphthalate decarboxylase [Pseudomonas syringae pv. syringae]POD19831.1 nitrate ABC transporter substrate-binding protein [Pseudomonas syringae pv. syringae]UQB21772.1 ABC transporter substrate-binding protein [Pseudomonas syringae pv. syringae]WHN05952.1 ABC transporter substrate-binding protein [Pseudomonas syringae pv. syringae]
MNLCLRLAVRDWDYLTPLALGDVLSDSVQLNLDRVNQLLDPPELELNSHYDGGEVSFSQYAQYRAAGGVKMVGIPHFLMRAFRHRCIITTTESPLKSIGDLAGKRIGLTGWPDSGNTWTRALLRREQININDVDWYVGRLTKDDSIFDRLNGFGRSGRINELPNDEPLVHALRAGTLDAVFTPFMPRGFYDPGSGLRQLLPSCRSEEVDYYKSVGYVPGIHLLAVKREVLADRPWLGNEISNLFDRSTDMWIQKREKYADTTPWIIDELRRTAQDLQKDWSENGFSKNYKMVKDFACELHAQGILTSVMTPEELFPNTAKI